ncbi:MAG: BamA/TamA family outer membrane protein [Acidobacteria bacterium]|nr:BamA/TamA family outer membrane protein [Acidobacteriota bacterium]
MHVRRTLAPDLVRTAWLAMAIVSLPASAWAQAPQSRDEALRKAREEKSKQVAHYAPGTLEKYVLKLENDKILARLAQGSDKGFYPYFHTIVSGSGIAVGPAYRNRLLFGRQGTLNVILAGSLKKYWMVDGSIDFARLADNHAFANVHLRRRGLPQEDFFGLGPDSTQSDFVSFHAQDTLVGAFGGLRPLPHLAIGGGVDYLDVTIGHGKDRAVPSIEERFTEATAPGLARQPAFLMSQAFIDLNLRAPSGNPRTGGQYKLTYTWFSDRTFDQYAFRRLEGEVQQYFSAFNQRRVLALRARVLVDDPEPGQQVPFYLMDPLGGSHELRSFRRYRFRDRNLIMLQAEYRWEILTALDGALFYDTGKVEPRRADINFRDLETSWGFGIRLGTNQRVVLRFDAAIGGTGKPHYLLRFNHAF